MSVQQFPEAFITEEEYIRRERYAEFKHDLPELNFLHGPTETDAPLKGEPQS